MDHSELVAELAKIEKLTAAERLKMARDRRAHQLRVFEQNERDYSKMNKSVNNQRMKNLRNKSRSVRFVHSVMLLEAAARNDIEEVRRLLMQGVSPDSTNEDGLTALHQCCIDDSETMMKLLLEFGADVNSEDSEKWTPLHAAATCGHLHLVKYLISKNANLLAVNADGNMPYDICEDEPTLDYIESEMASRGVTQELIDATRASTEKQMLGDLKSRNERLEFRNVVGATPLHIAAANGYLSVVEFLLDQHVATDVKDNDGWQPIHAAACWGHPDVLELLVQNGADLNAQTKNHETPFDICEDPDLKLKIAALRSEQETRARADNQKNRRSQSLAMNTRTHSVRRNSTRDKTLTSKKKIKNEAIIGIQDDDNKIARLETKTSPEQSQRVSSQSAGGDVESSTTSTNNGKRAAPPPPTNKYVENGSVHSNLELTPHYFSPQILTASALSDNKIDIHVSVTISTNGNLASNMSSIASPILPSVLSPVPSLSGVSCTLADLKKQRSHSRTIVVTAPVSNSCSVANSPFVFTELETHNDSNGNSSTGLAHVDKDSHKVNKGDKITSSSNAAIAMTKFRGETAELVGTKEKQEACCIIL